MTNRLLICFALSASALLASCSFAPGCGNSHPYTTGYAARPPLKAPAGATLPPADAAYQIPAGGTASAPAAIAAPAAGTSAAPCLVNPPSVLTKQDMAKPLTAAPGAKTTAAPAAASKAPTNPAPAGASHPRPVAGAGFLE